MDRDDDAIPPPIHRSRQPLHLHDNLHDNLQMLSDEDDSDDAAPPPIARSRSASLNSPKKAMSPKSPGAWNAVPQSPRGKRSAPRSLVMQSFSDGPGAVTPLSENTVEDEPMHSIARVPGPAGSIIQNAWLRSMRSSNRTEAERTDTVNEDMVTSTMQDIEDPFAKDVDDPIDQEIDKQLHDLALVPAPLSISKRSADSSPTAIRTPAIPIPRTVNSSNSSRPWQPELRSIRIPESPVQGSSNIPGARSSYSPRSPVRDHWTRPETQSYRIPESPLMDSPIKPEVRPMRIPESPVRDGPRTPQARSFRIPESPVTDRPKTPETGTAHTPENIIKYTPDTPETRVIRIPDSPVKDTVALLEGRPVRRPQTPISVDNNTNDDDEEKDVIPAIPLVSKDLPPPPDKNPMRERPSTQPSRHSRNFSHPFNIYGRAPSSSINQARQLPRPITYQPQNNISSERFSQYLGPSSSRQSGRPSAYRSTSKVKPSLRRWSSLETIESVTTTQSPYDESDDKRPSLVSSREQSFSGDDADQSSLSASIVEPSASFPTPVDETLTFGFPSVQEGGSGSTSKAQSTHSAPSMTHSTTRSSDSNSLRSNSTVSDRQTTSRSASSNTPAASRSTTSLLRKLKPSKNPKPIQPPEPLLQPGHLEISRRVSVDQSSAYTPHTPASSASSGLTISSGRPSELGFPFPETGSQSSSEWKASQFDISGLSEAELKKCKKKGINPALYAEMKAARKGKWMSPIAGNTFL